jgi:hypothetical protein
MMESAKYVMDVERNEGFIEVTLVDGKKEWIYSNPKGDWCHLNLSGVNYADFLRAMVEPNIWVLRKIARLELQNTWHNSIRAMRCLRILDPLFDPPYINKDSEWQMKIVYNMNRIVGFDAIDQCDDQWSLMTYANRLRALR